MLKNPRTPLLMLSACCLHRATLHGLASQALDVSPKQRVPGYVE